MSSFPWQFLTTLFGIVLFDALVHACMRTLSYMACMRTLNISGSRFSGPLQVSAVRLHEGLPNK